MADSVLRRVQRVVSASVENVVEAAERLSGSSLMREAGRELDRTMDQLAAERQAARTRGLQAEHQLETCRGALATLDGKARFAVQKGRHDLAKAALLRQVELEERIERLSALRRHAADEGAWLEERLAALRLRKGQMTSEIKSLEAARRAAGSAGEAPFERKAARAEAAFDRGLAAVGGVAGARADVNAAAQVAEIDDLQKQQIVADRMAKLLAAEGGAPVGATKKRKSVRKTGSG